jgi:hypothetical protein
MDTSTTIAALGASLWLSYVLSALAVGAIRLQRAKADEHRASAGLLDARARATLREAGLLTKESV